MNAIEKINAIYELVKKVVIESGDSTQSCARELINSELEDNIKKFSLDFPLQYSDEEVIYFFNSIEMFKEYLIEKLTMQGVIFGDDYYDSSDEWSSSSC